MERTSSSQALMWTALAYALMVWGDMASVLAVDNESATERPQASSRRATTTQMRFLTAVQQPEAIASQPPADTTAENGLRSMNEINLVIGTPDEKLPPDHAAKYFDRVGVDLQFPGTSRPWELSLESWEATALCHRPLYFEEVNLERYGKSFGIAQPAVSAVDMFGRVLVVPYLIGATPPRRCVYTLGQGRPGSDMPFYLHRPPVSLRGGLLQATTVTGMAFIVP